AFLVAAAGCQEAAPTYGPKPEEMRTALLTLMDNHPDDINCPEFRVSLEADKPVMRDGIVYIGSWNCDPKLMTFDGLFTAPNVSMYEVAGRFEKDNRGVWVAILRKNLLTQKHDVGEIWRTYDVEPRH